MTEPVSSSPPDVTSAPWRRTRGDRIFDWTTYGLLNGLGTFILTIPLAYETQHGIGKKTFEWGRAKLLARDWTKEGAGSFLMTNALFIGGTLMVIPVRIAEHFRKPIVDSLNRNESETVKQQVEIRPPQTWGSLLKSRVVAWGTVFLSFEAIKKAGFGKNLEMFEEKVAANVCALLKKPTHNPAALSALTDVEKASKEAMEAIETKTFRLGRIGALDFFASVASGILLYLGSRFFAKHRSPEKQAELQAREQKHPLILTDAPMDNVNTQEVQPASVVGGDKHYPGVVTAQAAPSLHA